MFAKPFDTFQIVRNCLMSYILAPKDLGTHCIFNNHKSKAPSPICRIHLDYNVLVFRYLLDIPHPLEGSTDGAMANPILQLKLRYCLLPLYVVGDYLLFVKATTSHELPSTGLAFIQLLAASQAIPDHI